MVYHSLSRWSDLAKLPYNQGKGEPCRRTKEILVTFAKQMLRSLLNVITTALDPNQCSICKSNSAREEGSALWELIESSTKKNHFV